MNSDPLNLQGTVVIADSLEDVSRAAAQWISHLSEQAIIDHDAFYVALSGGNTPRALYQQLAAEPCKSEIAWEKWHIFFSDERAVPPDDPASNYHLADAYLLSRVGIPADHVHRMPADRADLAAACIDYSETIRAIVPADFQTAVPLFDCVLLGLGGDGHTASLFPATAALSSTALIAEGLAPVQPSRRMTMTFPLINAATDVGFLVAGSDKRDALGRTSQGLTPAAQVKPIGGIHWFLANVTAGDAPA